jgi:hypothetical protein
MVAKNNMILRRVHLLRRVMEDGVMEDGEYLSEEGWRFFLRGSSVKMGSNTPM